MPLRYVGKELAEHRREQPCQCIHHSALLSHLHYAEPQRKDAGQSEGYLKGCLRRLERGPHHLREHFEVAHEDQLHQRYDEGYDEKRYPNVIQHHA